MVLSTAILTLVEARLARHPELTDGADDADPVDGAADVAMLLVALAITLVVPATSYAPLLLFLAADPASPAWRRLRPDWTCPRGASQEVANGAASAARSSRPRHNRLPVRARASRPAAAAAAARSG